MDKVSSRRNFIILLTAAGAGYLALSLYTPSPPNRTSSSSSSDSSSSSSAATRSTSRTTTSSSSTSPLTRGNFDEILAAHNINTKSIIAFGQPGWTGAIDGQITANYYG